MLVMLVRHAGDNRDPRSGALDAWLIEPLVGHDFVALPVGVVAATGVVMAVRTGE